MDDGEPTWDHPDKVSIPTPISLAKKRGVFAKKMEDFPASLRITPHDKILVETEAAALGLNFSTFVRWCAVQVARELCAARTGKKPKADL